jgi:hypothetical protein
MNKEIQICIHLVSNEALCYCSICVCYAYGTIVIRASCKNVLYVDCLFLHEETILMCLIGKWIKKRKETYLARVTGKEVVWWVLVIDKSLA